MAIIASVHLRKLDINTHRASRGEITRRTIVTHFYDRVVTLTKIGQKFISATSQGVAG